MGVVLLKHRPQEFIVSLAPSLGGFQAVMGLGRAWDPRVQFRWHPSINVKTNCGKSVIGEYQSKLARNRIIKNTMVKANLEKSRKEIAEKLEERGIDTTSDPPPLDEVIADIVGKYFLLLIQDYKSDYGGDLNRDRDRGILTKQDRDYLWDQSEYKAPQSQYKTRKRIRNRVQNSILDFTDLEFNLEQEDRNRIFDEFPGDLTNHLVIPIQFFYRVLNSDTTAFEEVVEQAVYQAELIETDPGTEELTNVDVSINVDRTPRLDVLKQRLEAGEPLTNSEIGLLVRTGEISSETLDKISQADESTTLERILKNRYEQKVKSEEE